MVSFSCGTKEEVAAQFHHHGTAKALWDHDWEFKCRIGVYPFNEGRKYEDFPPIFDSIVEKGIVDPIDERWPLEFLPKIKELEDEADRIHESQPEAASALYLRAAALCHIARYPILCSPQRREIWEIQKKCYFAGAAHWEVPSREVNIPFKDKAENDPGTEVPVLLRIPSKEAARGPLPVMLLFCGLDGFHVEMPVPATNFFISQGWAIVAVDEPGTADCPCDRTDPMSADRLSSTVLDFIRDHPLLDEKKVAMWGFSTGAYYALRTAHVYADRVLGAVAQGAHTHYALSPEWIDQMDVGEYPSTLTRSLLNKFGYETVEEMKADGQKRFSLIDNGIADMPHCKILLINGMEDTIYPVEDSFIMMQHGGTKEAHFIPNSPHMGEPKAGPIIYKWLQKILNPVPTEPMGNTTPELKKLIAENEALKRSLKQLTADATTAKHQQAAPVSPPLSTGTASDEDVDPLEAQGLSVGSVQIAV